MPNTKKQKHYITLNYKNNPNSKKNWARCVLDALNGC